MGRRDAGLDFPSGERAWGEESLPDWKYTPPRAGRSIADPFPEQLAVSSEFLPIRWLPLPRSAAAGIEPQDEGIQGEGSPSVTAAASSEAQRQRLQAAGDLPLPRVAGTLAVETAAVAAPLRIYPQAVGLGLASFKQVQVRGLPTFSSRY